MKQIKYINSMVGKTIKRMEDLQDRMFVGFTDDSYAIIRGGSEYIECDYGIDFICVSKEELDMYDKIDLDMITQEEFDKLCDEEDKICAENVRKNKMRQLKMLAEELNVTVGEAGD